MEKILVTGNKGFIGGNLYKHLNSLPKGDFLVYGIDSDYLGNDLTGDSNWDSKLINYLNEVKPTTIFHVGACSNTMEFDVNYMMIRNYESTKIITDWVTYNGAKLIYSSSASSYGINNRYPSNLYGWSKYIGEQYVIQNGGIALRYFNVYGPGEEHKGKMASVAYQMYVKEKKGEEPIKLFPNFPKRDFVYIKDVISANEYALKHYNEFKGEHYDVGSGTARTFEDVLFNLGINFSYTPEHDIPTGYQFYTCSDVTKFMKFWRPMFPLEVGIKNYKNYLDDSNSNR